MSFVLTADLRRRITLAIARAELAIAQAEVTKRIIRRL